MTDEQTTAPVRLDPTTLRCPICTARWPQRTEWRFIETAAGTQATLCAACAAQVFPDPEPQP